MLSHYTGGVEKNTSDCSFSTYPSSMKLTRISKDTRRAVFRRGGRSSCPPPTLRLNCGNTAFRTLMLSQGSTSASRSSQPACWPNRGFTECTVARSHSTQVDNKASDRLITRCQHGRVHECLEQGFLRASSAGLGLIRGHRSASGSSVAGRRHTSRALTRLT